MGLVEVKEKIYTKDEIPSNLVYVFKNEKDQDRLYAPLYQALRRYQP